MTVAPWQSLLGELFDQDMRERWGWSGSRAAPRSRAAVLRAPESDACVKLGGGGLKIPYFNGFITVDFGTLRVICDGVDQKTPADERWVLEPSEDWWARARACHWPLR